MSYQNWTIQANINVDAEDYDEAIELFKLAVNSGDYECDYYITVEPYQGDEDD